MLLAPPPDPTWGEPRAQPPLFSLSSLRPREDVHHGREASGTTLFSYMRSLL